MIHQRRRQTDDMRSQERTLHYSALRGNKHMCTKFKVSSSSRSTYILGPTNLSGYVM